MSLWNGFLRLLLIVACAWTPAMCAEEPPAEESAGLSKVLVLKSGRVVKGQLKPRGNGYNIDLPNGQLFVGSEQVWLIADSLPEAHLMMRDSFRSLTPDIHMQIAAWCANNQLWGTARRELLDALHLDPHREEASRMLATVIRRQQRASESPRRQESSAMKDAIATRTVMPRRSLGGLPSELAGEFTLRIQPLLSNRCANCHQPGSGRAFVFQGIRRGSTPEIAEANLTSVLAQLDVGARDDDSFLTIATMRHGTMKSEPFSGRAGVAQQERLANWIQRVQLATGRAPNASAAGKTSPSGIQLASDSRSAQRDRAVRTADYLATDRDPHAVVRSAERVDAAALTDARRRNRDDPFDPEIFNARYRDRSVSADNASGRTYRRKP